MEEMMNFSQLNSKIFRNTQTYLDRILKKYDLGSGTFRYLFFVEKNEGISQNKLGRAIGNDKAMSARSINKLVELGYVRREGDERNAKAYKLYLTAKGWEVIPKLHEEIRILENKLFAGLTEDEETAVMRSLEQILKNALKVTEKGGTENGTGKKE